jgi:hypothetical protein
MRQAILTLALAVAALAAALTYYGFRESAGPAAAYSSEVEEADSSAAAFARRIYPHVLALPTHPGVPSDRGAFLRLHGDEVERTLEVPHVVEAGSVAVALVRYSVGPSVYRDAVWLRNVGGAWQYSTVQGFDPADADPFRDGQPERARDLIAQAAAWVAEGAPRWW